MGKIKQLKFYDDKFYRGGVDGGIGPSSHSLLVGIQPVKTYEESKFFTPPFFWSVVPCDNPWQKPKIVIVSKKCLSIFNELDGVW